MTNMAKIRNPAVLRFFYLKILSYSLMLCIQPIDYILISLYETIFTI
jgi:hypothetical protein